MGFGLPSFESHSYVVVASAVTPNGQDLSLGYGKNQSTCGTRSPSEKWLVVFGFGLWSGFSTVNVPPFMVTRLS